MSNATRTETGLESQTLLEKQPGMLTSIGLTNNKSEHLRQEIEQQHRADELQRSNQRLELLSEVASQLLASKEPQKIVNSLCQKVLSFLDCHAFFNYLVDEQKGCLHLNTCAGIPEDVARGIEWLDYGAAVCGCAARDGCRIVAENIPTTPDPRTDLVKSFGIKAYACHPLFSEGKVLGTLSFGTRTRTSFAADELALMKAVADHIAIAMQRIISQQQLQSAKEAAEAANRAKDQFLATVSHELRTPLNAILGWTQLCRMGLLTEQESKDAIEKIEQNAKAQATLIADILDIARIINGKLKIVRQPVKLPLVIQAAIEAVSNAAQERSIQIQTELPGATATIIGDAGRLQQAIQNLLSNAIKFSARGGQVRVVLENDPVNAVIRVIDHGHGIEPELMPLLFDAFQQGDSSSTRHFSGLGLGLTIVQHIVEAHGGTVQAASGGIGQGAAFTVKLPRSQTPERVREAMRPGGQFTDELPSLVGIRVLAVDDEPSARELAGRALEGCGAQVKLASCAAEAHQIFRSWRPDVLVSDLAMPSEDGYMLLARIRALGEEEGGKTPAIALTACASADDRAKALASGFDAHLAKPVGAMELAGAVAKLARK